MKFFRNLLVVVLVNVLVTYGILYYFVLSKHLVIPEKAVVQKDLVLKSGEIVLEKGSAVTGKLSLEEGNIIVKEKAKVNGGIFLGSGSLTLEKDVRIHGDVQVKSGNMSLGENVFIEGNLVLPSGVLKKDSSATISGTKPDIYITSNWPDALAYFDILPESHKEALGYVFLTKENNTLIREPDIKDGQHYFDGIYYYENHKLHSINLNDAVEVQKYYERAKSFFNALPQRKLLTHGIGATTKNFAQSASKADIYVPSAGSRYTFIHEMGHVLDFKYNFSDFHQPAYPFISKEAAVNDYGATHSGEDFAEAYRYYVLFPDNFSGLIKDKPARQEKYDFLKKYVFVGKEYNSGAKNTLS